MAVSKSIESPSNPRLKQRASAAPSSGSSHTKTTDSTNHKQPRDTTTLPNDATNLAHEMPRMLLRLSVVTVAIACIAALAALAFPAVHSSLWTSKRQFELASTKSAFHAATTTSAATSTGVPTVEVLAVYPHDPRAFTQGLLVAEQGTEKFFIESTGLYGESSLRKVDIRTGEVRATHLLGSHLFGEGVTLDNNGELVMITWKSKKGFTFELTPSIEFKRKREFTFSTSTGEGWGIDYDGTHFVVSDGSSKIHFWDPTTLQQVREITVTINGQEIPNLNELEFANGYIYANVWYQSVIVKIDPADGQIVAVFDCTDLVTQSGADVDAGAVLNGIAYDGEEDVFYITGKLWSRVFKTLEAHINAQTLFNQPLLV